MARLSLWESINVRHRNSDRITAGNILWSVMASQISCPRRVPSFDLWRNAQNVGHTFDLPISKKTRYSSISSGNIFKKNSHPNVLVDCGIFRALWNFSVTAPICHSRFEMSMPRQSFCTVLQVKLAIMNGSTFK